MDLPAYETTSLLDVIQDLRREIVSLSQEVADLRREKLQFRQEAVYWKSMHAAARGRIAKLEAENEQLGLQRLQAHRKGGIPAEYASTSPS